METKDQGILFLLSYVLGESEEKLVQDFPLHMDITEHGKLLQQQGNYKELRDLTLLRNHVLENVETLYEDVDVPQYIRNKALEYGVDNYTPVNYGIEEDMEKAGINLSPYVYLNNLAGVVKRNARELLKQFITEDDKLLESLLETMYPTNFYKRVANKAKKVKSKKASKPVEVDPDVLQSQIVTSVKGWEPITFNTDEEFIANITGALDLDVGVVNKKFNWDSKELINDRVFTYNENSVYYVDCDNITFSVFMRLLNELEELPNVTVKLFKDATSFDIWNYVATGQYGNIAIEVHDVPRLLSNKSVVDQVLIGQFLKDGGDEDKYVVSSDSDYFSLNHLGQKYKVIYLEDTVSQVYKDFLKEKEILSKDIGRSEKKDIHKPLIDSFVKDLAVDYIATKPLDQWTEGVLVCFFTILIEDKLLYDPKIDDDYAKELSQYMLDNLTISREQGKTKIKLDHKEVLI